MKQVEASGILDFEMRSNAGLSIAVQIVNRNGQPFDDYTGSTFRLDLRTAAGAAEAAATLTSADGIVHDDLESAQITLQFPAGIEPGAYVYDLLRLQVGYEPQSCFSGAGKVLPGVTVVPS